MRKRFFAMFLAVAAGARLVTAEIPDTYAPPTNTPAPGSTAPAVASHPPTPAGASASSTTKPAPKTPRAPATAPVAQSLAQMQSELDQLTKSNHDLLDLLKQQQAVLEDIQFDRRLQSRQIAALEDRLEQALADKHQLETKIDSLEQAAERAPSPSANGSPAPPVVDNPSPRSGTPPSTPTIETVKSPDATAPTADTPAPEPEWHLPPEGVDNPPGAQTWHRLMTIKGTDSRQTDVFLVHGKTWRVLWYNADKPGKLYENTSALFINAFPRDDTIPQKVCAQLGTGHDATVLPGPGNYYLKIEASGGSWELAVEDLR